MINIAYIFSMLAAVVVIAHGQTTTCDRSHHCLHGGTCEKGIIANTGETIRVCNCAKAIDEFGYKYLGIHCEHQVPKADSAEEARDDPRLCDSNSRFCLHGGECRNNDDNDPRKCRCTRDYTGQHCEIPKSFDAIKKLSKGSGECDMSCKNGGRCQFGIKDDYKLEGEVTVDKSFYQHCECKNEFFGTNCEKKNEVCDVTGSNDDDDEKHFCQHGGKCVDTYALGESYNESTSCDCSAGNKLFKNKVYAGRYCEVQSTSICSNGKDNFNGVQFCTNYGTCISDESRRGVYSCSCPEGYTGEHCEFGLGYEPPVAEEKKCTKTVCQNGGKCKFGTKDHGLFSEMVKSPELAESIGQLIPKNSNENNEHCVCPEGYAGIHCELEAEICPHERKICFHGSKCIRDEDEDWGYSCSCSDAKSQIYSTADDDGLKGNLFGNYYHGGSDGEIIDDDEDRRSLADLAGDHCQYKATSRCSKGHSCFNDGVCYQDGCICHGDFKGPFCEYAKIVASSGKGRSQKRPSLTSRHQNTIVLFTFSLAFLGIAFVLLVVAFTRMSGESSKEMEGLTARRSSSMISRGHDVGATYLPYPTSNAPVGRNSIDSTDSNSTQSGDGMSPTEEKTVAELI